MNTFDFVFGLNLEQRMFSHTDNLSRTLQQSKDVSSKWQRSSLSYKRRSVEDSKRYELQIILWCSFTEKWKLSLHDWTDVTNENSRASIGRIEIGTGEPTYPVTAQDYYRQIYFEAIDLMMNAIEQRFDQPSFDRYANSQDKSEELKFMEKLYNDDVNISVWTAQMEVLQVLLEDGDYFCLTTS